MVSFLGKTCRPTFSCGDGSFTVGFLGDGQMGYSVVFNSIDSCILWAAYQEFVVKNTDVASGNALICVEDGGQPVIWFTDRDRLLEYAWATFDGIPVDAEGRISQGWFIFPEGTEKEDVWHWFAERYGGSIGTLVRRGQEAAAMGVPWE